MTLIRVVQRLGLPALLLTLTLVLGAGPAWAAEVLQVRSATLLQIGDQNRSYGVRVACLDLSDDQNAAATDWLRRDLPRRTRVNLRPQGSDAGVLLARVERLDRGSDVALDLIDAGFGQAQSGCRP